MKQIIRILVASVIAVAAQGDLLVEVNNSNGLLKPGAVPPPSGANILTAGVLVQLVWKADSVGYQAGNLPVGLLDAGEYILFSGAANNAGTFAFGAKGFKDSSVGGNDINNGYFFARIFETATPVAGDYFVEVGLQGPTLLDGDADFPALDKTYGNQLNDLPAFSAIDVQGTQVVPEPATASMMVLAGVGLFLARKKNRR